MLATPIACGYTVEPRAIRPEQISSWTMAGMPSRVPSTSRRCSALATPATLSAVSVLAPAMRVICPRPCRQIADGAVVVDLVAAHELEHPRGAELRHLLLRQHARQQVFHPLLDRELGVAVRRAAIDDAGVGGHPLVAPAVKPLTNWRSATR